MGVFIWTMEVLDKSIIWTLTVFFYNDFCGLVKLDS